MEMIRQQEECIILRKGRKRIELQVPLRIGKRLGTSACVCQGRLLMCISINCALWQEIEIEPGMA